MSKPDWKDAPEWASVLAQDANGQWYWYELDDLEEGSYSWLTDGKYVLAEGSKWNETLERRP